MRRFLLPLIGLCALSLTPATATAATPSGFTVTPTANLGPADALGIAAASSTAAWMVGVAGADLQTGKAFMEQWNGVAWSQVMLPLPKGAVSSTLSSVTATGPTSAWAVGTYESPLPGGGVAGSHELVYQLTAAGWQRTHFHIRHYPISYIASIAAASPHDIWMIATVDCDQTVFHFNGQAWAAKGGEDECDGDSSLSFNTVSTTGSHAAWLVGDATAEDNYQNGVASCMGSLCPPRLSDSQLGIQITAATGSEPDAWLVGESSPTQPLVLDWQSGGAWQDQSPNFSYTTPHQLQSAVLLPDGDLWAVGSRQSTAERTLILERTSAGTWQDLGGPNVGTADNKLIQVVHVPGTASEMWALGESDTSPLLLHHS